MITQDKTSILDTFHRLEKHAKRWSSTDEIVNALSEGLRLMTNNR